MATGGIYDLESGGDETFDLLCVVCKGNNKNTEADMFCSECHDYYCHSCIKCHDVIPALKNHQILDKSTAPLPAVPTMRCKDHKDKPIDMYCKNHNVVGCSTCMLVNHRSCEDKRYIPDFIKDEDEDEDTDAFYAEVLFESVADSLKELQKILTEEREYLKDNKKKVFKEIGTLRKKINQLLDQFEKKVLQELEQRFTSLTDQIDSSLSELQAKTTEVKATQDGFKSAGGNIPQKFVCAMQVVSSAEEKVKTNKSQFSPTEMFFLANKKLQTLFSEIQDLGSIKVREKLRIRDRQKYPLKMESDRANCTITSICVLKNGIIILADRDNSKLKCLDSSTYVVTDCYDIPQMPLQVCAITDTEVAVSCLRGKLIQFINVGRTMTKTREIKINFWCVGLAYADERLFVAKDTSVYVFSLSGQRLQQLYNGQSRKRLFSDIAALAVSSDKSMIYVADFNKGLIILDMNGQLVRQYNGDKLSGACGVCLDNNDNMLVCGRNSKNVLQFSPNGKMIGEVLKTESCTAVCCRKNSRKLLVGCWKRDEIEEYDINAE